MEALTIKKNSVMIAWLAIISSPDPTFKEERGLVNLGRILGPSLRNFHTPMRSQLCSVSVT